MLYNKGLKKKSRERDVTLSRLHNLHIKDVRISIRSFEY